MIKVLPVTSRRHINAFKSITSIALFLSGKILEALECIGLCTLQYSNIIGEKQLQHSRGLEAYLAGPITPRSFRTKLWSAVFALSDGTFLFHRVTLSLPIKKNHIPQLRHCPIHLNWLGGFGPSIHCLKCLHLWNHSQELHRLPLKVFSWIFKLLSSSRHFSPIVT